jgi:hypothetical protein
LEDTSPFPFWGGGVFQPISSGGKHEKEKKMSRKKEERRKMKDTKQQKGKICLQGAKNQCKKWSSYLWHILPGRGGYHLEGRGMIRYDSPLIEYSDNIVTYCTYILRSKLL